MEEIKNKRITRDVIFEIATLVYEYYSGLMRIYEEDKSFSDSYKDPRYQEERAFVINSKPHFSIDICTENQDETVNSLDKLKYSLDNHSSKIKRISINFSSYYRKNASYSASVDGTRVSEEIYFSFRDDHVSNRFDYQNATREYEMLRRNLEGIINDCPVSYDKIISSKYFRKNLPSLSVGLLVGIVVSISLSLFVKQNNSYDVLNKFVNNQFYIPVMLAAFIFIGLVIPGKNHYLYSAMKIKRKYAGWTRSSGTIYKDDIREFVNNCEVEIGQYHKRGALREAIEENYDKSKKIVLLELLVFIVLYFVL